MVTKIFGDDGRTGAPSRRTPKEHTQTSEADTDKRSRQNPENAEKTDKRSRQNTEKTDKRSRQNAELRELSPFSPFSVFSLFSSRIIFLPKKELKDIAHNDNEAR